MSDFHHNPDFTCSRGEAARLWEGLQRSPVPLVRPVIVLNGYHAPRLTARGVAARLRSVTSNNPDDFLAVSYTLATSIESAAHRAMKRILDRWPTAASETRPFDVVGISMGGLVARLLASPGTPCRPRLNISRLFTLATPHRGAILARWIRVDSAARQMDAGSAFLSKLNAESSPYEIVPYTQLRDWWVGSTKSAPPEAVPIWADTDSLFGRLHSHVQITHNRRFLADIARRLRGEPALARVAGLPPRD